MAINYRTTNTTAQGINSFDLDQHTGTSVNNASTETFTSFLNSSTRYIEQIALNFSGLLEGKKEGALAYVENAEGTSWLPYTVGGTYYPKGWYQWDGVQWITSKSNIAQALDAGTGSTGSIVQGDNISLLNNDAGYITVDNNTQRTDLEINNLIALNPEGFLTVDNNTQLSDADITALGYIKTDNDTQRTDQEIIDVIALQGYGTSNFDSDYNSLTNLPTLFDNDYNGLDNLPIIPTQITDTEIEALGYLKTPAVLPLAKGGALGLEQGLLAGDGQPALTILAVATTTSGKVQGSSLSDGNVIEAFANGADFNSKTVLYREFLQAGEVICFTGLAGGAIITSTGGFYGFSEQVNGGNESPMPLMSLGLAFTDTFFFAFRNSNGADNDIGEIYITCGALPAEVALLRNGAAINGQENIALEPFESTILYTNQNNEFQITATSPVMGATQARMGGGTNNRFYDARLIMPLTNDGITWPRSGNVSAPYDNTVVDYYVRDGASGDFTVSPNAFIDFDGAAGSGAGEADYEPNGATRVKAKGLISAYSGADSAGLEASPLMPTSAMSQIVAQPLFIDDSGDGGNSGIAIASPYEGTAKVYSWNSVTGVADLSYTVPLTKGSNGVGITYTTVDDQNIPASGIVANEAGLTGDPSYVELVGDLNAGYIIADVPITVVVQNANPTLVPIIRSQNGTTTTSIVNDDDETLTLGFTPDNIKTELTKDVDGYIRRREIDASGVVTYPLV